MADTDNDSTSDNDWDSDTDNDDHSDNDHKLKQFRNNLELFSAAKAKIPQKERINKLQQAIYVGANVNANDLDLDKHGNTVLHTVVRNGETEVVEFLLNEGADVTIENNDGLTPIDLCKMRDSNGEMKYLKIYKKLKLAYSNATVPIQNVLQSDESMDFVTGRLKNTLHGSAYQIQLLTLCVKRALDKCDDFYLGTEMSFAESFDGIVLKYKEQDQNSWLYRFVQVKHRKNDNQIIKSSDLTNTKDGDLSILKYFYYYMKMKNDPQFQNHRAHFILFTNIDLNVDELNNSEIFTVNERTGIDPFLTTNDINKIPHQYHLTINKGSYFYGRLLENSVADNLAKALIYCLENRKLVDLSVGIFRSYHIALTKDVIDRNTNKFHDNFIMDNDLSETTRKFRAIFKNHCSDKWDLLKHETFLLPKTFGKKGKSKYLPLPSDTIDDKQIEAFFNQFTLSVNQPSEDKLEAIIALEMGDIIQFNRCESDFVTDNIQSKTFHWFTNKRGLLLSRTEADNWFKDAITNLNTILAAGSSAEFGNKLDGYGISFDKKHLLNKFIIPQLWKFLQDRHLQTRILHLVTPTNPRLNLIRLYQLLQYVPQYTSKDSVLITTINKLLQQKTRSSLLQAFGSFVSHDLCIIECKTIDKIKDNQMHQKLIKIIELSDKKKLILLAPKDHPLIKQFDNSVLKSTHQPCYQAVRHFLIDFDLLNCESRYDLLKKKIIFQGQKVSWNKLISKGDSKVTKLLPLESLLKQKKFEIDKPIPISYGYDQDYYINRSLNHQLIKVVNKVQDTNFELVEENQQENIHWLHKQASGRCIWKQFQGSLANLRKYNSQNEVFTAKEILNSLQQAQQQPVMIIAGTARTGKSTLLTHLSTKIKQTNPSHWVVRINLSDHIVTLKEKDKDVFTFNSAIEFVKDKILNIRETLDKQLFMHHLEEGKVVIMLDGFNEICPTYESIVMNLIKGLKEKPLIQLWITTSTKFKGKLEDAVHHLSFTLEPVSKERQETFLVEFWEKNIAKDINKSQLLKGYAKELVEKNLIDNPLQIRIVAELFQTKVEKYLQENEHSSMQYNKLELLDLYKIYIENKLKNNLLNLSVQVENDAMLILNENHYWLAIESFFDRAQAKELLSSITKNYLKCKTEELYRIGLVEPIHGEIDFIDRSISDYFLAAFVIEQLKADKTEDALTDIILMNIFVNTDYKTVRTFINQHWANKENCPSESMKEIYGKRIDALWEEDKKKLSLSGQGVWDGTILDQAVREDNPKIVKFLLDSLKSGKCVDTLKSLVVHTDEYGSVLHRAGWIEKQTDALDEIFEVYMNILNNEDIKKLLMAKDNNDRNILHRIARWGRTTVLDKILKLLNNLSTIDIMKDLLVQDRKGQSVWQRAARSGNVDILTKLLEWCKKKEIDVEYIKRELLTKDKSVTAFNKAVKWGHVDMLDMLINNDYIKITDGELKIALFCTDNKSSNTRLIGRGVFHRAVYDNSDKMLDKQQRNRQVVLEVRRYSRIEMLEKLLKFCKQVKLPDDETKQLLERGNQNGNTALHLAVKKNLIEETEWLAEKMKEYEVNLNVKNDKKETPLMCAASSKNWDIVAKLLTINNYDGINDLDAGQCNLLKKHIASDMNKELLLQKLEQRLSELESVQVPKCGPEMMDID